MAAESVMTKKAAILRWTGRGDASDFRSSVNHVLLERGVKAEVRRVGGSLVLSGPEPVGLCSTFENMPGVAWTAAGFSVASRDEVARASSVLASRYLKRGEKFSVQAEASGRGASSDLAGAVTSAMLEEVKGARASSDAAGVRVRAALDGARGVVGIEVSRGPGGSPMGRDGAVCLVSGGRHSAVLAWSAVLQGFRVNMVHVQSGEGSLFAAARLSAALSNRGDPRGLSLTLLRGGEPAGVLPRFLARRTEPVFGGFTVERPAPAALGPKVQSPLFMMAEETFESQFGALGVKSNDEVADWGRKSAGDYIERRFGGKSADVSAVIDGLA